MSQRDRTPGSDSVAEGVAALLDTICRFALTAGAAAALIGIGLLLYNLSASQNLQGAMAAQGLKNVSMFGTIALAGTLGLALSITYLQWGEEVLGPLMVIVGFALYWSPAYLPGVMGLPGTPSDVGQKALGAVQTASLPLCIMGIVTIVLDVVNRARTRAREGTKAEQLKLGKGLKEEKEIRNVFLGKCWQLPYCRKFVREKCPIYHARRTCWKERVGCMCEESVIRNAMEGKIIPADSVGSTKYIPYNTKLSANQKAERCKSCVIYNEHLKHQYKLAMPVAMAGMGAVYVFFHDPLANGVHAGMAGIDKVMHAATLKPEDGSATQQGDLERSGMGTGNIPFHEIILVALMVVSLAYVIRFIEFVIFKIKA